MSFYVNFFWHSLFLFSVRRGINSSVFGDPMLLWKVLIAPSGNIFWVLGVHVDPTGRMHPVAAKVTYEAFANWLLAFPTFRQPLLFGWLYLIFWIGSIRSSRRSKGGSFVETAGISGGHAKGGGVEAEVYLSWQDVGSPIGAAGSFAGLPGGLSAAGGVIGLSAVGAGGVTG